MNKNYWSRFSFLFPAAHMLNALSMTAMLIAVNIIFGSGVAADFGIAQASLGALFCLFSANERNIILATASSVLAKSLLNIRIILILPLVLAAVSLNAMGGIETNIVVIVIIRRTVEWIGHIDLCEKERIGDTKYAAVYAAVQIFLFCFAILWQLMQMPYAFFGMTLWAFAPLLLSIKYCLSALSNIGSALSNLSKNIIPHFGSAAVIGVAVYIFRLLIVSILGKNISGDLFAAFAIGGVMGSIVCVGLGPSIALYTKNNSSFQLFRYPMYLTATLWGCSILGLVVSLLAFLDSSFFDWTHKDVFFWKAIGFSLVGSAIMARAQLLRSKLLIHDDEQNLFGSDVLANIGIVASVPFLYQIYGVDAITGMSLVGAILTFLSYKSAEYGETHGLSSLFSIERLRLVWILIGISVVTPIFVQLGSGIFLTKEVLLTGGNSVMQHPIPLFLLLTYLAIVVIGRYRLSLLSLSVMFTTFLLLLFPILILNQAQENIQLLEMRVLLAMEYLVPMGALVLGEMYEAEAIDINNSLLEKGFLMGLAIIVPLQLAASWMKDTLWLTSDAIFFSVYQHLTYVPTIIVSVYTVVIFSLWTNCRYRKVILVISPLMGIYATASQSLVAVIGLIFGVCIFAISRWKLTSEKLPIGVALLVILGCFGYAELGMVDIATGSRFDDDVINTISAWKFYTENIFNSVGPLLFGHFSALANLKFSSGYNYYLDLIFNFGLISFIPIAAMVLYTIRVAYLARCHIMINPALLGNLLTLIFLLVIDNSVQVSMRQPYSGVFIFFIWGLFLARIKNINLNFPSVKTK